MRLLAAGVADHDVESAQPVHRIVDQLLAEGFVAQIAGQGQADAALRLDQGDDFPRIRFFGRENS